MSRTKKNISVSSKLFELLMKKKKENNFRSVDEYVEHILFQVLQPSGSEEIDPEEEKAIKERLEKLGYL